MLQENVSLKKPIILPSYDFFMGIVGLEVGLGHGNGYCWMVRMLFRNPAMQVV